MTFSERLDGPKRYLFLSTLPSAMLRSILVFTLILVLTRLWINVQISLKPPR